MKRAITGRILRGILLINGIVLLLTCGIFFLYEYVAYRQSRVDELTAISRVISANASAALAFHDADAAREILSALQSEPGITAACLYDAEGKLFATFPASAADKKFPAEPGLESFGMVDDGIAGFHPVTLEARKLGTLYMHGNNHALYERMIVYGILAFCILIFSSLVTYLLYKMLKNRMLKEVQLQTNELRESQATILAFNQQLEQRVVERTEQLEHANKELESFSYSVSHDLRAPLRSIHGYLNILHEEYSSKLDEEGQRVLNIVLKNAQRMGQLIDELLAFSKLGRKELIRSEIRMTDMVNNLVSEQKSLGITGEFIVHPLPAARGDNAMIRQVWTNLISNAVKYSRKKERPVIEIGSVTEAGTTTYFVRDNGAGFDMQYYDKLFGVFQRLHSTKEFEGTGVGLAIVQRVVAKHGGKVSAEGKINEGAVFYFSLSSE